MVREISQVVVMYNQNMFNTWKNDYWNWLDVASFLLCFVMIFYYVVNGQDVILDRISAAASLIMWCKFLGLIKAINQKISTFVLMLTTIFYDVYSFMFVLFCVMLMFGQALFITLAQHDKSKESFGSLGLTLRSCYTMMLGDFETDTFPDLFSTLIFVAYMFVVVICMLNVLIAIVSDSYDNAMVKSPELYYRSRLELIAEISTTFHRFLVKMEGKIEKSELDLKHHLVQSNEGDDWAGKVLDIVKRINRNTGIEIEQVKRDLNSQNEMIKIQNELTNSQLAALLAVHNKKENEADKC